MKMFKTAKKGADVGKSHRTKFDGCSSAAVCRLRSAVSSGGFTLLEVLLTTAILLIGLTVIFHTTRSALRSISAARELTEAQNACHAILNELLAQSALIRPDEGKAIPALPHWKIRIDLYPASQSRLYVLHLTAQQFSPQDGMLIGIKYHLIRWIPIERVWFPPVQTEATFGDEWGELLP